MYWGKLGGEWLGKRHGPGKKKKAEKAPKKKKEEEAVLFFGVTPGDRYLFRCFHIGTVRKTTHKIVVTFRFGRLVVGGVVVLGKGAFTSRIFLCPSKGG